MKFAKWAWRYGHLGVTLFASLEEAFGAAEAASDSGSEALECFEEIETGRIIKPDDAEYSAFQQARWAAERAAFDERPSTWYRIEIQSPNVPGYWAHYGSYQSEADASAETVPFPKERTRIRKVP